MKGKLNLYYDDEGDYLEVTVGEPEAIYGEELGNGVTLMRDEESDEVVGVTILRFRERSKSLQDVSIHLPFDVQFLAPSG